MQEFTKKYLELFKIFFTTVTSLGSMFAVYLHGPGAFVCRGGVEIAKFAIFRDKSRNRRFSAKNREIDNFPRQIAI